MTKIGSNLFTVKSKKQDIEVCFPCSEFTETKCVTIHL